MKTTNITHKQKMYTLSIYEEIDGLFSPKLFSSKQKVIDWLVNHVFPANDIEMDEEIKENIRNFLEEKNDDFVYSNYDNTIHITVDICEVDNPFSY